MGITINNRLRKAMTAFLFWESNEDLDIDEIADLAISLYDLAADYQALLEDYRNLEAKMEHLEPEWA